MCRVSEIKASLARAITAASMAALSIEMAVGKAPDMSQFDAGVCPFMERSVEAAGASTADEIRAAVKEVWKQVTPEMCVKISLRVRRNMHKVIELKGGNFYEEH